MSYMGKVLSKMPEIGEFSDFWLLWLKSHENTLFSLTIFEKR